MEHKNIINILKVNVFWLCINGQSIENEWTTRVSIYHLLIWQNKTITCSFLSWRTISVRTLPYSFIRFEVLTKGEGVSNINIKWCKEICLVFPWKLKVYELHEINCVKSKLFSDGQEQRDISRDNYYSHKNRVHKYVI